MTGQFAGATQETPSVDEKLTKTCPVHNSISHTLEQFKELPAIEKEKLVHEHKLCLSCLLPGHRLNKCNAKNRSKVEGCSMHHHTLVHEVDLNIIERPRARKAEKLALGEGVQKPSVSEGENKPLDQSEKSREQCHYSVCLGCEVGGRALVKELPVLLFSEKGEQQVMALRDSGCNTTLMDEELAQSLGLKGKEIELQIQGVNAEEAFTSQHTKNCRIARVGREGVKYVMRDVKTFLNLSGPDHNIKWSRGD